MPCLLAQPEWPRTIGICGNELHYIDASAHRELWLDVDVQDLFKKSECELVSRRGNDMGAIAYARGLACQGEQTGSVLIGQIETAQYFLYALH